MERHLCLIQDLNSFYGECACVRVCMCAMCVEGGGGEGEKQTQIFWFIFCVSPKLTNYNVQNKTA